MPWKILYLALAGAVGTLGRYWLGGVVQRLGGEGFAWGTMGVNLLGSFLFGLVWTLASERMVISPETRLIVLTGFMGAFTTFSTFMFETGQMIRASQWMLAGVNLLAQCAFGLLAVFLGWALARAL